MRSIYSRRTMGDRVAGHFSTPIPFAHSMSDGDDNVGTDGIGRSEFFKAYEFVIFSLRT